MVHACNASKTKVVNKKEKVQHERGRGASTLARNSDAKKKKGQSLASK